MPATKVETARSRHKAALQFALLGGVLFWIVAWYWTTAVSMMGIWWRSETFAHGMVVYPIALWLIWRKRAVLASQPFEPSYLMISAFGAAGFGWLLGTLTDVQAAQHFSLVAMIALAVWAIAGTRFARVIAFPLAYTLLAVPVGEFLLPILIEHTADFTVGALRLTGIPVYREGNNFIVPSGSWSVVEACSGLRYLIASITLGLLYAYLTYSSPMRRGLFILASVIVPIVANWVRAYMIVMIGHLSGMKYAVGVDHLIYGWVFFGVVILILFWVGSFWREDPDGGVRPEQTEQRTPSAELSGSAVFGALLVAGTAALAPSYAAYLESELLRPSLVALAKPVAANGWAVSSGDGLVFQPHYTGSRSQTDLVFERDGRKVGLFIGYYAQQRESAELISFHNAIVGVKDRQWRQIGQTSVTTSDQGAAVVQTKVQGPIGELMVWHWYWAGGRATVSPQLVKVRQAINQLLGAGDDAAIVLLYTTSEGKASDAGQFLKSFYEDMHPAIEAALEQTRRARRNEQAEAIVGAT